MLIATQGRLTIQLDPQTLRFSFRAGETIWKWAEDYEPTLQCGGELLHFSEARGITHEPWQSGVGSGILSRFADFPNRKLAFETLVWIETATETVHLEWIPLEEEGIEEVRWPGCMEFDTPSREWYSLLNLQQGLLLPNNWPEELNRVMFDGHFGTAASYMPWFGQIRGRQGCLAICRQPWDAAYTVSHPAGGPYTHIGLRWFPSLGEMAYRRCLTYDFFADCDYNTLCKAYRRYVQELGTFRTLREKAVTAPVEKLVGCAFVHAGIKTHVQPDSRFFDAQQPDKNNHVTPFSFRERELTYYHDTLGIPKLYLHLDGWAEPGYDNCHPDYFPACLDAGGWEGMRRLVETAHRFGYLFGVHDQYRDYYFKAESFDLEFATRLPDGAYPEHASWAGGRQSYLCGTQALYYVRRNFKTLFDNGVRPDCAYLDVFTCNEGDECDNPRHRMTRRACYDYRAQCFSYLLSRGILSSSEEVTDWAVPTLVFCHYAPYEFMLREPGSPKAGIPVPLFNLVYHDCVLVPWMMERHPGEDYMLYALLNGGAPYLVRKGAYENVDGAFLQESDLTQDALRERCLTVCRLHEKVAFCELMHHEFVDGNPAVQRSVFSDGTVVTVDFETQRWEIV